MFQSDKSLILWKIHLAAKPEKVYQCLADNSHRQHYWAERVEQLGDCLNYFFHGDVKSTGKILAQRENSFFQVSYFGWQVSFELIPVAKEHKVSTDLIMRCEGVSEQDREEVIAGWVSWLMAFKGYVDFNVDLRNHDQARSWFTGFCDN